MTRRAQLAFEIAPSCKVAGCPEAVVGSSITGAGHVCERHNVEEWGRALSRNRSEYFRAIGQRLLSPRPTEKARALPHFASWASRTARPETGPNLYRAGPMFQPHDSQARAALDSTTQKTEETT